MNLLEITNLSHTYGDKTLYRDQSLTLFKGEHMGVVGQNGSGKSTLIRILLGETIPDVGRVVWHPNVRVGHLDQHAVVAEHYTIVGYLKTAFQSLYDIERKMNELYEKYASSGNERDLMRAAEYQATMEAKGFYLIDTRIERVMNGLGLSTLGGNTPLSELSGGQRARAILAKLLLDEPDVLLVDEPTNHLDKEHVQWLSGYLSAFPNAFVIVSHDYAFLEAIAGCICDVDAGTLKKYQGTYSHFLRQKQHLREEHLHRYRAQQQQIRRTEEFIRRNIAGRKTKNAQGRRKQLQRMERIDPPSTSSSKPAFRFLEGPGVTQDALQVKSLVVGYQYPLLPPLDFSVSGGQKLAITGFNGIGKSTLLKTLIQQIPQLSGEFAFSNAVRVGYYEQELGWEDPSRTALQIITECIPSSNIKEARRQLARCGIRSDHAMQEVATLSGGEQAKVKLCKLMLSPCNFLILDEPTNHLDALAKEAFQDALRDFGGTVIIVSHETAFYRSWVDDVLDIEGLTGSLASSRPNELSGMTIRMKASVKQAVST